MAVNDQKTDEKAGIRPPRFSPLAIAIAFLLLWLWQDIVTHLAVTTISYSEFKEHLRKGELIECEIGESDIYGKIRPKEAPAIEELLFRTTRVEDAELVEQLQAAQVKFTGTRPGVLSRFLWAWFLPIALMWFFWSGLSRRVGSLGEGVIGIGKSRAKLVADKSTGVSFKDVAGCEEAKNELEEVVNFLQSPERYRALGAKIPKGVLLLGPPGTGKTLLARAVAGEARVPFYQLSGSDFVEMFVGVGAARVRDLFEQAKKQAPCIIFIDELDAIGRQRGVHVSAVNDEREQTLNQLLVELDGFEPNTGVIVLAATNRPDVLDRALLRPGRFDRQVVIDAPDLNGRLAILEIHARGKPLAKEVDLRRIAQATPGFSGADLANVVNEAALLAARNNAHEISQPFLEEAIEKVVAGPERKSRRLGDDEKKRVAFHEAGHALVSAHSKFADPIRKISIVPRGRAALGYTLQYPDDERFLITRSALIDKLKTLLGGRAAELIVYDEVTTGAEQDLEQATILAEQMVCLHGMSPKLGLFHCGRREGGVFLNATAGVLQRDCSEETSHVIDEEVKVLLDQAFAEAKAILIDHKDELEKIAVELLKHETIDSSRLAELLTPAG